MLIPFPITGNRTVFSVLAGIGFKSRAAFYTSIIQHSGGKVLFSPPSRSTATGTEFFLSFMGQLYQGLSAIRTAVLFFSSEIRFDCIGRDTEGFCNFSCLFSSSKHLWNDFFLTLCHRKYLLLSSYGEKTAIWVQIIQSISIVFLKFHLIFTFLSLFFFLWYYSIKEKKITNF